MKPADKDLYQSAYQEIIMNSINDKIKRLWLNAYGPHWEKPVFGVSNIARLKPVSSATETS